MFGCLFFIRSNKKIKDETIIVKNKCLDCAAEKNIVTLVCHHNYCVKCYTKNRYCIACDKKNKRNWCWCCS